MASKRRKRRVQCGTKHRLTKDQAMGRAVAMRRTSPGESFDAYPCPHGDHWHVGHRTKKARQQIAARRRQKEKDA